ncbi:hypothetical protein TTHERM_00548340 (macronuclear) [Tetrahymena thermophila SB210]|uniref:GCC2 and GCC3 family protein n=1 Tax=Tetrahymena thermophila (strain SB210) TaxID=312017 RepID=I7MDA6_TETTS|nr:hypothetical protein TTHERM_00548340 [Tetrahymena thermophila SB210]EAR86087.2 hypothetical protein TTHERM_00548340 [Tetrahymena thermophila SB210]|eukprot:XP_976682.2 hypothetical protein TTHERM_00548340 [Tetrahymena thermophila SB210]
MYSKVFCLILAFALLQIAYTADCERCTFSADGKDGKGPYTQCEEGTCTPEKGTIGTSQLACSIKKCQAGQFSETGYDSDGKGKGCTNCDDGTYSLEGSTECNLIPCGYGFYNKTGYYDINEKDRDYECEHCPYAGPPQKKILQEIINMMMKILFVIQSQKNVLKKCTVCPIGKSTDKEMTIGDSDKACTVQFKQCPEGTFNTTGYDENTNESQCKMCRPGTHSLSGSINCELIPCDYGYYSSTGYYNFNEEDCTECPPGKSTKEKQTIGEDEKVCDVQLQFCPQGKFSYSGYDFDGKGNGCSDCKPGTYSLEGSTECNLIPCGYGFYNINGYYNNSKETECQKCPIGKSTPLENTQGTDDKVCSVQSYKCPENKWSNTGYDYDGKGKGCKHCEAGTYSTEGSTVCDLKPCGYNSYSSTGFYTINQKEECKACPKNTYTNEQINKSLNDSICIPYYSSEYDESESESENKSESERYDDIETTSSSIIIKTTLSLILLVALF